MEAKALLETHRAIMNLRSGALTHDDECAMENSYRQVGHSSVGA
jgi:hypothetical protein